MTEDRWKVSPHLDRSGRKRARLIVRKSGTAAIIMGTARRKMSCLEAAVYLACLACLTVAADPESDKSSTSCPHPAVPFAATYQNISGGPDGPDWKIKYVCDRGYELIGGPEESACSSGAWPPDKERPRCAVNVALNKPAAASSETEGGPASNAVDGRTSTVHEGNKCFETKPEKSPWITVDLLTAHRVEAVRLTTRCCDDSVQVTSAEVRVGNSSGPPADNQLCNWIPRALGQGTTETLDCVAGALYGRYVSIIMAGVEATLSLCEVEVLSSGGGASSAATLCADGVEDLLATSCFHVGPKDIAGYEEADR